MYKIWARLALVAPVVHLYFCIKSSESTSFLGGDDVDGNNHYVMLLYHVVLSSVIMSYGGQLVSRRVGSWSRDGCVAPLRVLYIVYLFFEV